MTLCCSLWPASPRGTQPWGAQCPEASGGDSSSHPTFLAHQLRAEAQSTFQNRSTLLSLPGLWDSRYHSPVPSVSDSVTRLSPSRGQGHRAPYACEHPASTPGSAERSLGPCFWQMHHHPITYTFLFSVFWDHNIVSVLFPCVSFNGSNQRPTLQDTELSTVTSSLRCGLPRKETELSPGLDAGRPVSVFVHLEPTSGLRGGDALALTPPHTLTHAQKLPGWAGLKGTFWKTQNICRTLVDDLALKILFAEPPPPTFSVLEASRRPQPGFSESHGGTAYD